MTKNLYSLRNQRCFAQLFRLADHLSSYFFHFLLDTMRLTSAAAVLLSTSIPASMTEVTMASQLTDVSNHANFQGKTSQNDVPAFAAKRLNIRAATQELSMMILAQTRAVTEDGVLYNEKSFQENEDRTKECDPSSEDPDIGILSCGENQHCMATKHSNLGGFCATAADSRELAISSKLPAILHSLPCVSSVLPYTCDCSNFSTTTLSGSFNCVYQSYHCKGCPEYCGSVNFTLRFEAGANLTEYTTCYDLKKPYDLTFCVSHFSGARGCIMKANETLCNICIYGSSFDCSNIPYGYASTANQYPTRFLSKLRSNTTCPPGQPPSTAPAKSNPSLAPAGSSPTTSSAGKPATSSAPAAPVKSSPTKASGTGSQYGLVGMRILSFTSFLIGHFAM